MGTLTAEANDAAVHAGIIARQPRALEIWEERYRRRMIDAGIHHGLPDDAAEEVWFSEVLTTIWDKAAEITPLGSGLVRYSFGIMRMQARSHRRQEALEPAALDDVQANPGPLSAMRPDRRAAVRKCLEALSPRDRLLIELVCMERVEVNVVAAQLGIMPRSVQRATERAMQKIRPCLEDAIDV